MLCLMLRSVQFNFAKIIDRVHLTMFLFYSRQNKHNFGTICVFKRSNLLCGCQCEELCGFHAKQIFISIDSLSHLCADIVDLTPYAQFHVFAVDIDCDFQAAFCTIVYCSVGLVEAAINSIEEKDNIDLINVI